MTGLLGHVYQKDPLAALKVSSEKTFTDQGLTGANPGTAWAQRSAGSLQEPHTTAELAELFAVARSTVYRATKRAGDTAQTP